MHEHILGNMYDEYIATYNTAMNIIPLLFSKRHIAKLIQF